MNVHINYNNIHVYGAGVAVHMYVIVCYNRYYHMRSLEGLIGNEDEVLSF